MRTRIDKRRNWVRAGVALALLAFSLRALVPVGYMPTTSADARSITVTLCTIHGPVETEIGSIAPVTPKTPGDRAPRLTDGMCVFAATTHVATPTPAAALAAPPTTAAIFSGAAVRHATARALASPPPWATGPPLL